MSWRSAPGAGVAACHCLFRLQSAGQAAADQAEAAAQLGGGRAPAAAYELRGHSSQTVLTRSAFLDVQQAEPWLVSADEAACSPCVWDVGRGGMLQQRWDPLAAPVVQLAGGLLTKAAAPTPLLAACCASELRVYAGRCVGGSS